MTVLEGSLILSGGNLPDPVTFNTVENLNLFLSLDNAYVEPGDIYNLDFSMLVNEDVSFGEELPLTVNISFTSLPGNSLFERFGTNPIVQPALGRQRVMRY